MMRCQGGSGLFCVPRRLAILDSDSRVIETSPTALAVRRRKRRRAGQAAVHLVSRAGASERGKPARLCYRLVDAWMED